MLCQKILHESCRIGRGIIVMKPICSLGHCEYDGHTVHKLSQRRFTADWLAPRESDCSEMRNKVSSDWVRSYTKATWPVLEILKNGQVPSGQPSYAYIRVALGWVLRNYVALLWVAVGQPFSKAHLPYVTFRRLSPLPSSAHTNNIQPTPLVLLGRGNIFPRLCEVCLRQWEMSNVIFLQ